MMTLNEQIGGGLLNKPPLIIPEKMPEEIIGDARETVRTVLMGYQKSTHNWDDYAKKLDFPTRAILEKVFFECRCNGFFNPRVQDDSITFQQAVKMTNKLKRFSELTPAMMREI